jgi:hypothetical protein
MGGPIMKEVVGAGVNEVNINYHWILFTYFLIFNQDGAVFSDAGCDKQIGVEQTGNQTSQRGSSPVYLRRRREQNRS